MEQLYLRFNLVVRLPPHRVVRRLKKPLALPLISSKAMEVCAFVNASGGFILIGVNNRNGFVEGFAIDNTKRSSIQDSLDAIQPAVECEFYPLSVSGHDIDFQRTQTLCQGGQKCDFCFVRHRKGEVWERTESI